MTSMKSTSKHLGAATLTGLALVAALGLNACSNIPFQNHNSDQGAVVSQGKRISIVAFEQKLQPSKTLAGIGYYLPGAQSVDSWPVAGGPTGQSIQHAAAASDFKIAWTKSIGAGSKEKSAVLAQPVSDGKVIYTLDGEARVSAFDVNTGATVWSVDLDPKIKRDKVGFGGGLALDGGTLFVTSGFRMIVALDAATGKTQWEKSTDTQLHAAPAVNGQFVFATDVDNQIFAYDKTNGEMGWTYQAIAEPARLLKSSSPLVSGNTIFAPFSSGELVALNATTGDPVWEQALAKSSRTNALSEIRDISGRPTLYNGTLYAASHSGMFEAINSTSGDVKWQIDADSINSPWVAGDVVFLVSLQGELMAVSKDSGQIYWLKDLNEGAQTLKKGFFGLGREKLVGKLSQWVGPVLASDRLVLFNDRGEAVGLDPKTGEQTASLKLGGAVYIAPIIVGGKLFVLTDDAKLIAIG